MILALGILPLALGSCANTTAGPSGGDKDTIPPVLLTTVPDVNQVNVSTQIKGLNCNSTNT